MEIFFSGLLPLRGVAQDSTALLQKAAASEAAFREEEALIEYKAVLAVRSQQLTALIRCSDLSCRIGNRQTDRDKKIDYYKAGHQYAQTAYRLDPTNSEVNIVMAFSLGRMVLIQNPPGICPLEKVKPADDRQVREEGRKLLHELAP